MQQTTLPLTDEEKANAQLLEITGGIVTEVTDPDKLTGSLVLPDGITEIGDYAFLDCTHLTELTVDSENPVYCSDNNILYTKDKKKLITAAGGLKGSIVIPNTVTGIADYAFWDCRSLTSVSIPAGVTRIGERAFSGCTALTGVTWIDEQAFLGCTALTRVRLPDTLSVLTWSTFSGCSALTDIVIPDSVTAICPFAFYGCSSLTDVIIPDSVTVLDDGVFSGCTGLTRITIPANVTWIGDEAFSGCTNLKTVIIDSAVVEKIKDTSFENIHADVHFTVKTDAVKALLKKNSTIRDEQITIEPNANVI